MFEVYGKVKEVNPDCQVIVGCMKWHEDHWAAWDLLFKPTIDKNIQYIDGLHEHHYSDVTDMAGSETMVAYCKTKYDKWIYGYNTETTDLLDVPAVGVANSPER